MVGESTGRTREKRAAGRKLQDLRVEFPTEQHGSVAEVDLRWEFPRRFYEADSNYRLIDSQMNKLCVPPEVQNDIRAYIVGQKENDERLRVGLTLRIEDFGLPLECLGDRIERLQFESANLTMEGKIQEAKKAAEDAAILFDYGTRLSLGYLKAPETKKMPTGLPVD